MLRIMHKQDLAALNKTLDGLALKVMERVAILADTLGQASVDYLQSYTDVVRPPVRRNGSPRLAHPGGWADISKLLRDSYYYKVHIRRQLVELELGNTAPYAPHLEKWDGYYVVSGITDRGGPVEQNLRDIAVMTGFQTVGL